MNYMKTRILLFAAFSLLIMLSFNASSQTPNWLWAKSAGSNGYDYATSVATDTLGNSYVTGYYNAGISFDATHSFTSSGSSDIYLVKYDPAGNVLWAKTATGGTDADVSNSIAVDRWGNVFIAGYYKSTSLTFGTTTLTNAGGNTYDLFFAKYDTDGNVLWAKTNGGTGDDRTYGIAVDSLGDCFITGYFVSTTLTFGTSTLTNSGSTDIFLAMYTGGGTSVWARQGSGTGADYANAVTVDRFGFSYITGRFNSGTLTFGSNVLTKVGNYDVYITKYAHDGSVVWAKRAGVTGDNVSMSVAADTSGNCYIAGNFRGSTIIFGIYTLTNAGTTGDMFLAKYDQLGNVLWAKSAGGTLDDGATAVTTDKYNYCYLAGYFKSTSVNFGTGALTNNGTSTADMTITEYSPSGTVIWAKSAGGTGDDVPNSIAVDTMRNFYYAGYIASPTVMLDTITLTCAGTTDMFIAKSDNTPLSGINESSNTVMISVFPNPASTELMVKLSSEFSVQIINMHGQLCYSLAGILNETKIGLENLPAGIYILKVITDEGNAIKKFIKE